MIRIIQHLVLKSQGKTTNSTRDWEMGISADRIKSALADFSAIALPTGYFWLTRITEDLALIAAAVGVDVALRIPSEPDIRKLKYEIDNVIFL